MWPFEVLVVSMIFKGANDSSDSDHDSPTELLVGTHESAESSHERTASSSVLTEPDRLARAALDSVFVQLKVDSFGDIKQCS